MSEIKAKFVNLAIETEKLQDELNKKREELSTLMVELGVDTYTQDPILGTVYKVVVPKGRFISYVEIDYVRTALEGERAGSLSKKEAEANGFKLE